MHPIDCLNFLANRVFDCRFLTIVHYIHAPQCIHCRSIWIAIANTLTIMPALTSTITSATAKNNYGSFNNKQLRLL